MFGRVYKLTITCGQGEPKVFTDLDIRFNIRKNSYFITDATIDILNPNRETMDMLFAHQGMYAESKNERKVKLEIGWADVNGGKPTPVFDGVIMTAMPTTYPPEIWVSMKCIGAAYGNDRLVAVSKSGPCKIKDVLSLIKSSIAKPPFNLTLDTSNIDTSNVVNRKLQSFASCKKVLGLMKDIEKLDRNGNLRLYYDNGTVKVIDVTNETPTVTTHVNKDTGMIGLPRCNWPNYYVETLFRSDIDVFSNVTVDSGFKMMSNMSVGSNGKQRLGLEYSGVYRVMGITYVGQFRSGKWVMALDLVDLNESMKGHTKGGLTIESVRRSVAEKGNG